MTIERVFTGVSPLLRINADIVAVYDQLGNGVFPQARFLKALITPNSKPMEHPIETGAVTTDHRIILPTEIELPILVNFLFYKNTYQQINQLYNDGALLTVETKVGVYQNQLIISFPHEESPEHYNSIVLTLKLKEVLIASSTITQTIAPRNPANSTTVDRGTISPTPTTPAQEAQGSFLFKNSGFKASTVN